jgi:RecA/RadA recombinase
MPRVKNNLNLDDIRAQMKKKLGSDFYADPSKEREILSTGFHSIDDLLNGGLRKGTYTEFYGGNGVGKTYVSFNLMAQAQKQIGKPVCYVDLEQSWVPERAREQGVIFDEGMLDVVRPSTQEEAYDFLHLSLENDIYGLIVIDSISGMVPSKDLDEEMSKASMGMYGAKNNAKGMRILTGAIQDTIVIFINQIRDDTKNPSAYGHNETTSGGKALLHFYHMRIHFTKRAAESVEEEFYNPRKGYMENVQTKPGHVMRLKITKSKFNGAIVDRITDLLYLQSIRGISLIEDLKNMLYKKGHLSKEGNYYTLSGVDKKLQKKKLDEYVTENYQELEKLLKKSKG